MTTSLKIFIPDLNSTKSVQYPTGMYISDICKDLREKFNFGDGGQDHGLLLKEQGVWLAPIKMLAHYDLNINDAIEFRKKHRVLKVKTLDLSMKNVLIDDSATVKAVVEVICAKMGLANPDEYSLMSDKVPDDDPRAKKKKTESVIAVVAETRQWLNPDKSLREQGYSDEDVVVLKKKFFVTDQNVDRTDPVQLVMMYTQGYDMIVSGKLPCTFEEAAQFGGLYLQISAGNHDPTKHKPGFKKLTEMVPPEYQKSKEVEKACYKEHSVLSGLTELNAKYRYLQLVRSLKTYGTTFFLVKETPDKNKKSKKEDVLLGVTKGSVVRMNIETKAIVNEWKLTSLRRWAATQKTFTLDFGDHADSYYQVETTEGEEISRLIAGYIDILIKKRQQLITGTTAKVEEQSVLEDYVKPGKVANVAVVAKQANVAMKAKPIGKTAAQTAQASAGKGEDASKIQSGIAEDLEASENQTHIMRVIKAALETLLAYKSELIQPMQLPLFTNDSMAKQWRGDTKNLNRTVTDSHVSNVLAEIAGILISTSADPHKIDYDQIGLRIHSALGSIGQTVQGIRMLSAIDLDEDGDGNILDQARELIDAILSMLNELKPVVIGKGALKELHTSSIKIGNSAVKMLTAIEQTDVNDASQNDLMTVVVEVGDLLTELTNQAKLYPKTPGMAKDVKVANETLDKMITSADLLAAVVSMPVCRVQLADAVIGMRDITTKIQGLATGIKDEEGRFQLEKAAENILESLEMVLEYAKNVEFNVDGDICDYNAQVEKYKDLVLDTIDSKMDLFANAKELTICTTRLAECFKSKSSQCTDPEMGQELMDAAKNLSGLAQQMVAATKAVITNHQSPAARDALVKQVVQLAETASKAASPYVAATILSRLRRCFKGVVSTSNLLSSAARQCAQSNRDRTKQAMLNKAGKEVIELVPRSASAITDFKLQPDDYIAKQNLVKMATVFLGPSQNFVAQAAEAAPNVSDRSAKQHLVFLSNILKDETDALADLLNSSKDLIQNADVGDLINKIKGRPLDRGVLDLADEEMSLTSHAKIITGVLKAMKEKKSPQEDLVKLLNEYQAIQDIVGGITTIVDEPLKKSMLDAANLLAKELSNFVKNVSNDNANTAPTLSAIEALLVNLPQHKAMRDAIGNVKLLTKSADPSANHATITRVKVQAGQSFAVEGAEEDVRSGLLLAASDLSFAAGALVENSKGNKFSLRETVGKIETAFASISKISNSLQNTEHGNRINQAIASIGKDSAMLLVALQTGMLDNDTDGQLALAAKNVSNTIDELMALLSGNNIGAGYCSQATQALNNAATQIAACNNPIKKQKVYEKARNMLELSSATFKDLETEMYKNLLAKDSISIARTTALIAKEIDDTIRAASNAGFLLSDLDPDSVPSQKPAFESGELEELLSKVRPLLDAIEDEKITVKDAYKHADSLVDYSAEICALCENALARLIDPAINTHLSAISEKVALAASALVPAIKKIGTDKKGRPALLESCKQLQSTLHDLAAIANSPVTGGTSTKPGAQTQQLQGQLTASSESLLGDARKILMNVQVNMSAPTRILKEDLEPKFKNMKTQIGSMLALVQTNAPGDLQRKNTIAEMQKKIDWLKSLEKTIKSGEIPESSEIIDLNAYKEGVRSVSDWANAIVAAENDGRKLIAMIEELPERFESILTQTISVLDSLISGSELLFVQKLGNFGTSMTEFVSTTHDHIISANSISSYILEKERDQVKVMIDSLLNFLNEKERIDPKISQAILSIEACKSKATGGNSGNTESWLQIEAVIKKSAQDIGSNLSNVATNHKAIIGDCAAAFSDSVSAALESISGAVAKTSNTTLKGELKKLMDSFAYESLSTARTLQQAKGTVANDPKVRNRVVLQAKDVNQLLNDVNKLIQGITVGVKACGAVQGDISTVINDMSSAVEFSKARQLRPVSETDSFENHRDLLLQATKMLAESLSRFPDSSLLDQETLSVLITSAGDSIKEFSIKSTQAAASLGSSDIELQEELLICAQNVVVIMNEIINDTKDISGSTDKEEVQYYIDTIKDKSEALVDMQKVIEKATESAKSKTWFNMYDSGILKTKETLLSTEPPTGSALPVEVIELSNHLTKSIARVIEKIDVPQEQLVSIVGQLTHDVENLAQAGKALAFNAPEQAKKTVIDNISNVCQHVIMLGKNIQTFREGDIEALGPMKDVSRAIGNLIAGMVKMVSGMVPEGYEDPNDANIIAERELLEAAKQLATLAQIDKPREPTENLKFEDHIMDGSRAIAAACSALLRSATAVQREIVAKGKLGPKEEAVYFSDGTWSEGLVSGARMVVGVTRDLYQAADDFAKETVTIDKVVVNARNVSAATVQLLTAAGVRADPRSATQLRLRAAGKAVTDATEQLLISSKNSRSNNTDEVTEISAPKSAHQAKIMEMEIQVKILKLEKELEQARSQLAKIRKNKYTESANHDIKPSKEFIKPRNQKGTESESNAFEEMSKLAKGGFAGNTEVSFGRPSATMRPNIGTRKPSVSTGSRPSEVGRGIQTARLTQEEEGEVATVTVAKFSGAAPVLKTAGARPVLKTAAKAAPVIDNMQRSESIPESPGKESPSPRTSGVPAPVVKATAGAAPILKPGPAAPKLPTKMQK